MSLVDLLLPPACAGCGGFGSVLCSSCRASFRPPGSTGVTFVQTDPGYVVGEAVTLAVAAFRFDGALRRALSRLKYGGAARVARPLALAAHPRLQELLAISGPAVLVPVPVHPARRRRRGYNQASLIAAALAAAVSLPMSEPLARTRVTARQHALDRAARLRNLQNAFALRPGMQSPPVVILVDDILTTSATLETCARVLRAGGAQSVYGFAIAREV